MADLAITTGIHTSQDVLKALMAGAKVTMMASDLLQNGIRRINVILDEMSRWMDKHEFESVVQMIGSMSQQRCAEPVAFERANYMKMLASYRPINYGKLNVPKLFSFLGSSHPINAHQPGLHSSSDR